MTTLRSTPGRDFVRQIVDDDQRSSRFDGRVVTRFPPEPNGYLHIGHAKSVCLNFGLAAEFGGVCHLRFDDTNPTREQVEYVEAIQQDVRWLGWDWKEHLYYASDYFEQLYAYALDLIAAGRAYVCDLSSDQIRLYRGTLIEPGRDSPFRDRSVQENLELFKAMRRGAFEVGSRVLRARIDMVSGNLNLRDPVLYRILKVEHHRTKDAWCIYPTYDFAHGQSDSIERVTHSICTMEFEDHRPLYDWLLEALNISHPQQIEFARLNLGYTVLSKRKLSQLVEEAHVSGWDDPRMPTLSGMRRRGYPPEAIRAFCDRIGVAKRQNVVKLALLEHCVREHLNRHSRRVMGVLDPLRVVIDNYPADQVEQLEAFNNPEDPDAGTRQVPFTGEIFIERDDFRLEPPPRYFRLAPGREVRLRYGYFIRCQRVEQDPASGQVTTLHCTYDPATRGGQAPDGRKVKGTIHWVSAPHALEAEVYCYEPLFTREYPEDVDSGDDYRRHLNPESLTRLTGCRLEPSLAGAQPGDRVQFERVGYFCVDPDSTAARLVFNRTVPLRDSWARIQKAADPAVT